MDGWRWQKNEWGEKTEVLARHSIECTEEIDWENTRILRNEYRLRQRKVIEGIESLRVRHNKKKVLNSFESLMTWRPILNKYFIKENERARARTQFNLN